MLVYVLFSVRDDCWRATSVCAERFLSDFSLFSQILASETLMQFMVIVVVNAVTKQNYSRKCVCVCV